MQLVKEPAFEARSRQEKKYTEGHRQKPKVIGSKERDLQLQSLEIREPGMDLRQWPTCKKTDPGKGPVPGK